MTSMRKASLVFLLLLTILFVSSEEMARVEGRTCMTPSRRFRGICFSSRNCATVCYGERFPDGTCQGFRRRCMCLRPC